MADLEAAARMAAAAAAPAQAPVQRAAAATVADAVVYCCLGATWVGSAASVVVIPARYAVATGRGAARAASVVRVARGVFMGAHVATGFLLPLTILVLLLRLDKQQAEPPEQLLLIEGVYATVQLHGPERPAARGRRRGGAGYGLISLLVFIFYWMSMLAGLLLQDRSAANATWSALIGDIGSVVCSVIVMFMFVPYVLVQLKDLPSSRMHDDLME